MATIITKILLSHSDGLKVVSWLLILDSPCFVVLEFLIAMFTLEWCGK